MKKKKNFLKGKTVLVTGYEGFLGSWLVKILLEKGASIVGVDKVKNRPGSVLKGIRKDIIGIKGDIVDLKLINRIIERHKPSVIFHLAAEAIVEEGNKNPVNAFKSNIEGTWNILEASRNKRFIKSVVVASSDKAYGSHKLLPYSENAPLKGDHPYDVSKSCADLICFAYYNTYQIPVCVTRCGNIYGPGDHNFSRIVPDAIRCALTDRKLLIRSDGKFVRDYIYVEDIVMAYILLAETMFRRDIAGEDFNFSDENPLSVLGIVKKIYSLARPSSKKANVKILNQAKYEIKKQYLSSGKARRILKWKPIYSLEKGMRETIKWYKDYIYNAEK